MQNLVLLRRYIVAAGGLVLSLDVFLRYLRFVYLVWFNTSIVPMLPKYVNIHLGVRISLERTMA